jgi:hypothetical protein
LRWMNIHIANASLAGSAGETVAAKRPSVLALRGFVCDRYIIEPEFFFLAGLDCGAGLRALRLNGR